MLNLSGSYILIKKEQKKSKKVKKKYKKVQNVRKSPKKGVQSMIFWSFPTKFGKKTLKLIFRYFYGFKTNL